jgi:hypothetical protein
MSRAQIARLGALQTAVAPAGGVIHQQLGETVEAAVERAKAAGRRPPFVVMPARISAEQWQAEAAAQQQELVRRAAVYMSTGRDPGDDPR